MNQSPRNSASEDPFEAFGLAFKKMKEQFKGDMGIMGWEGRSPMHVGSTPPAEADSKIGDLWFQP